MVEHILLLQWTPQATPQSIDRALTELRGLKEKIPGILEITTGKNFSTRAKNYTHGAVFRFKDRASCDAYFPHPDHQHVVQTFISPIRADTLVLDYEF